MKISIELERVGSDSQPELSWRYQDKNSLVIYENSILNEEEKEQIAIFLKKEWLRSDSLTKESFLEQVHIIIERRQGYNMYFPLWESMIISYTYQDGFTKDIKLHSGNSSLAYFLGRTYMGVCEFILK